MIRIKERGWAGHYILGDKCLYHRNTLVTNTNTGDMIIVSTVGNMRVQSENEIQAIGLERYYETLAFNAVQDGGYIEIDAGAHIHHPCEWSICAERSEDLPIEVDNHADDMHDNVVAWVRGKLETGRIEKLNDYEWVIR